MTPEFIILGIFWFIAFIFSTSAHEAAHALAARIGGDPTAYLGGQVSLSPLPHIKREPVGMVLVPLMTYFANGWMMGWASAPYNPYWAARYPRRAALMALAGPGANLLIVIITGILIKVGVMMGYFEAANSMRDVVSAVPGSGAVAVATLLGILFYLNLILGIFNLFPLPPLDGGHAITLLMPRALSERWLELTRQPGLSFLGLILAWKFGGIMIAPAFHVAMTLLYPAVRYGS